MRKIISFFCVLGVAFMAANISLAMTDEENEKLVQETKNYKFKTVTTKEGLNFNIPEDMPIEKRNGVTAPIPFDEYMYFKLRKVEEKLASLEKKIDELQSVFSAFKKTEAQKALSPAEKAGVLSRP